MHADRISTCAMLWKGMGKHRTWHCLCTYSMAKAYHQNQMELLLYTNISAEPLIGLKKGKT